MVYALGGAYGGQTNFSRDVPVGMPGTIEGFAPYAAPLACINGVGGVAPAYTITPPAIIDASTEYSITIDGITVRFTTPSTGATTLSLGTALYAALRAEAQVFRKADFSLNATSGVITATSRLLNVPLAITAPSNAATTNDLTIAQTVNAGVETRIPFGRFVGRKSTYSYDSISKAAHASLIDAATGYEVLGITMKQVLEKDRIGPGAQASYPFMSVMNVIADVGTNVGFWTEVVDLNINPSSDLLYIATSGSNAGKATNQSSGNVDFSAKARFVSATQVGVNGIQLALVYIRR